MIINDRHQFVFACVPRTGSVCVSRRLLKVKGSYEHSYHHQRKTPKGKGNYYHFATVRNPFARAVSLWAHQQVHRLAKRRGVTFYQFCHELKRGRLVASSSKRERWMGMTQSEFLSELKRLDLFIRLEHLTADLRRLAFLDLYAPLPKENATEHAPWPSYYKRDTARFIVDWAKEDFERFGYDTRSWKR